MMDDINIRSIERMIEYREEAKKEYEKKEKAKAPKKKRKPRKPAK